MNLFPRLCLTLAVSSVLLPRVGAQFQTILDEGETATGYFYPLSCNDGIEDAICTSWVDKGYVFHETKVEIPCGECVTFDEPHGSHIMLEMGLSVVGKLVFPPNTNATIETPFIYVEGLLEASSNETVNSTNIDGLHFIMTGDKFQPFFPHTENKLSCDGYYCDVGKKPIVVAGGKLNIHGLNETCPTWVKLHDVGTDKQVVPEKYPVVPTPPSGCMPSVIYEDFETNGAGLFKSSLGCRDSIDEEDSNKYLKVTGRKRPWQGAFINVDSFLRDCMIPDQIYLIRARYRLIHEGDPSSTSNCHTNGTDCLSLKLHTLSHDEKASWKTLFETPPIAKSDDGVWTDFIAMTKFDATDFNATSLYQVLYFGGPEADVRMDIDDVSINLPWENHFPLPDAEICTELIINGDAEVDDKFAYPVELLGNIGSYLKVNHEIADGVKNNYFTVTGREEAWTSIYQGLIQDCVVEHTVYSFSMRNRIHSEKPSSLRFTLKTTSGEDIDTNYSYESVGTCPPISIDMGWVLCEFVFLFKETHQNATKVEVQIMEEANSTADIDFDDFSVKIHSHPVNQFIVSSDVAQCWGVGAQIVQTSHTITHSDYNEFNITNITVVDDKAVVSIGTPIYKPTTEVDDPRFAVEIALLSRNIAFTSKDDDPSNPFHGPHMMILHTPNVAQNIVGIDFRGFGQQGTEGRYPVHFHMCGNVNGTLVARNTVRHSHQRCYVVHATDFTRFEYNIAFDTFGHCFMLEDGIEEENSFSHNLGLGTKLMPEDGLISIAESDQFAATFWVANPKNYFLGNVAAGSEDNGFWYEFLETIRGTSMILDPTYLKNPTQIPLGFHRQNIMHSNKGEGFKLYPNGYFPEDRGIFEDVMSFRNHGDGVLLHNSKNLGIDGGVFADNRRAIDIDKQADDVTVTNAVIIGFSDLYQLQVQAGKLESHCPAWLPLVGIQLHSFLRYRDSKGYVLNNVTFENFGEDTGCVGSVAIEMDAQVRDGHFDAYSSFYNLTFSADSPSGEKFNMCNLEKDPMFLHDLIVQDDGSLNPSGSASGVIVSNSTAMTAFSDSCVDMVGSCALYCENGASGGSTCYRGLNIATWNAPDYEELFLEVTDSKGNAFDVQGYFEIKLKDEVQKINETAKLLVEVEDEYENTIYQRRRFYSPIIPHGDYTMRFKMHGLNTNPNYWPQFVEIVWEDRPECSPYIGDDEVTLSIPSPNENGDECSNLVLNSGGEMAGYDFWAHTGGVMEAENVGPLSGSYTISSVKRTAAWHGIGQFLDTRCLTIGRQYEIIVNIRIRDGLTTNYVRCDVNQLNYNSGDVCPRVIFRARKLIGNNIGDEVETTYAYPMASAVEPWREDEWNKLVGQFTVSEKFAEADSLFFNIERSRAGIDFIIDDVSIHPTTFDCYMPLYNGDFEVGDTRYWGSVGTANIDLYSPGYHSEYALRTTSRGQFWASMTQNLNTDCFVEGERFSASAMILLLDGNDQIYDCTVGLLWGDGVGNGMDHVCPTMSLRITSGSTTNDIDIGSMAGSYTSKDWNSIYGVFEVTASMIEADTVSIYFRKVKDEISIVVDDLSIIKAASSDSSLLVNNGDFSIGDARYYNIYGGGHITVQERKDVDYTDYSMMVFDRSNEDYGVKYVLSSNSFDAQAVYTISCEIRLTHKDETSFKCDPSLLSGDTRCPTLSLRSQNTGMVPSTRFVAGAPSTFKQDQYNEFSGIFQFLAAEVQAKYLSLIINNAPANIVMFIDNIQLSIFEPASNVTSDTSE